MTAEGKKIMELTGQPSTLERAPTRRRTPPLLLLAAPLLLVLAACGSSQVAGGTDPGNDQSTTVEKGGVQMTISPSSGPVGTLVQVEVSGAKMNPERPWDSISFRDSTGSPSVDGQTTEFRSDTRNTADGDALRMTYRIPESVVIIATPGAQAPTVKSPTSAGTGLIVFSSASGFLEVAVPFAVIGR